MSDIFKSETDGLFYKINENIVYTSKDGEQWYYRVYGQMNVRTIEGTKDYIVSNVSISPDAAAYLLFNMGYKDEAASAAICHEIGGAKQTAPIYATWNQNTIYIHPCMDDKYLGPIRRLDSSHLDLSNLFGNEGKDVFVMLSYESLNEYSRDIELMFDSIDGAAPPEYDPLTKRYV